MAWYSLNASWSFWPIGLSLLPLFYLLYLHGKIPICPSASCFIDISFVKTFLHPLLLIPKAWTGLFVFFSIWSLLSVLLRPTNIALCCSSLAFSACASSLKRESVCHSVVSNSLWPPWTVARQAPLSREFSRQEYWSGVAMPSSGGNGRVEICS